MTHSVGRGDTESVTTLFSSMDRHNNIAGAVRVRVSVVHTATHPWRRVPETPTALLTFSLRCRSARPRGTAKPPHALALRLL